MRNRRSGQSRRAVSYTHLKGLSALVYTQLTDVEDEVNGLFTYDRTAIKPDAAAVRAVNEALEAEFEKAVKA